MKVYNFIAQIEFDKETGMYIGFVPELPGAHTQAKTLDELNINLKEVTELCLDALSEDELNSLPEYVGMQQLHIER